MCLALPARVTRLDHGADTAMVDLGGIGREVSLALVADVQVGDYLLIHVGYALNKLSEEEALRTLELFAQAGLVEEMTT